MGAKLSKTDARVVRDVCNKTINNTLKEFTQENSASVANVQKINITVTGAVKCDTLVARNTSATKIAALSQASNDTLTQLGTTMATALTSQLKSNVNQGTVGLPLPTGAQVNLDDKSVQETIRSTVVNNVKTTTKNMLSTSATNNQEIVFSVGSVSGKDCTFTNENMVQMVSKQMTQNIVKDLIYNYSEVKSEIETDTTVDQSTDTSISGILFGSSAWITGSVLVLFVIIAIIVYFYYSRTSTPTKTI